MESLYKTEMGKFLHLLSLKAENNELSLEETQVIYEAITKVENPEIDITRLNQDELKKYITMGIYVYNVLLQE